MTKSNYLSNNTLNRDNSQIFGRFITLVSLQTTQILGWFQTLSLVDYSSVNYAEKLSSFNSINHHKSTL